MKMLTIRGVPDELHAQLLRRAKLNRRSLNQQVIAELIEAQKEPTSREAQSDRAAMLIAKVEELRGGLSRFMTADEIDAAKLVGRK